MEVQDAKRVFERSIDKHKSSVIRGVRVRIKG